MHTQMHFPLLSSAPIRNELQSLFAYISIYNIYIYICNTVALVRERTIDERPPPPGGSFPEAKVAGT
jgi:hypothetical protein